MEKIKKLGKIIWGITYITGGLLSTILIMPLVIGISLFNAMKKNNPHAGA
jgi:hypothetical protein